MRRWVWSSGRMCILVFLTLVLAVTAGITPAGAAEQQPDSSRWSTHRGYLVRFYVLGRSADPARPWELTDGAPVDAAIKAWAAQHSIPLNEPLSPAVHGRAVGAALYVGMPGRGGSGCLGYNDLIYELYLAAPGRGLAGELAAALAALPATSTPEVRPIWFAVNDDKPAVAYPGGPSVIIDGAHFSFPMDFTPDEARQVSFLFKSHIYRPGDPPLYAAFERLSSAEPQRIRLGDIVRLAFNDGALEITTVLKDWPAGRALYHPVPNWLGMAYAAPPEGMPERDFDPVAALLERGQTKSERASFEYYVTYEGALVPPGTWEEAAKQGALSPAGMAAKARYAEIERAYAAWRASHPEYAGRQGDPGSTHIWPFAFNGVILGLNLSLERNGETNDAALTELLTQIPELAPAMVMQRAPRGEGYMQIRSESP